MSHQTPVQLKAWEPYGFIAASSGTQAVHNATANATFHIQPVIAQLPLQMSRMNIIHSFANSQVSTNFALNTTGQTSSRTFGFTQTFGAAVYVRQSGANSSLLTRYASTSFSVQAQQTYAASVSSSNSLSASISMAWVFPSSISSDYGYAYTTLALNGTTSTSATGASLSRSDFTSLNGLRIVAFPFGSTLTQGEYWIAHSFGSSTNSGAMGFINNSVLYINSVAPNSLGVLGSTAALATNSSIMPLQGMGFISTNASTTNFPNALTLSKVSIKANNPRIYWNMSNYPL